MNPTKTIIFAVILLSARFAGNAFAGSGAIDPTYAPVVTGFVNALAVQPNGQLLIAGNFTSINSQSRYRLARLYADGTLDPVFLNGQSGPSGTVNALVLQSDGHILIAGNFSAVNGTTRPGVARLNPNGTLDGSFVPTNYPQTTYATAVQSDNKVIVGGAGFIFRLNADGTMDSTFVQAVSQPTVYAIAVQPDGKILIGGAFSTFIGTTRNNLARLNTDGTVDGTFLNNLTGASSNVRCIQVQSDGKVLIGGDFTTVNGTGRYHVARLTSAGILDTGFAPGNISGNSVYAMALQPDNSIVIGGSFSDYYYNNGLTSYSYNIARLYPDGSMDNTFYCPNNYFSTTYALGLQSDGGILAGGNFTYSSTNRYLARVYGNLYPPEFTLQPTNRAVAVGTNVTFTAHVNNPTTTYFQWRKNGTDIAGATEMAYTLYNVQLSDAGVYAVFANNSIAGVTSSNALLQVGMPPAITQPPASLTVTQGQPATFTLGASGTPLNYYWKKNGVFIPGATNAALTFANAVYTNAGSYMCQVSNFLGNLTSVAATLTVYAPPAILAQPAGQTVGVSSNFTVAVSANGTAPLAYQWLKDGNLLANPAGASITITNAQVTDGGGYSVIIANSFGSVTSAVAVISVTNFPPFIVTQPAGGNYPVGSNFSLSVVAGGTAPFAYQWSTNGAPIPGAVAASYAVTNAQTNDSWAYTVTVTNISGGITSAAAVVNVGYAPVVVQQPLSVTNNAGGTNGFAVTLFGSSPLLYQWFKDGMPIPNATNISLMLPNLQSNQVGYYFVSVTNIYGGTVSSNAALVLAGVPFSLWQGLVAYYPFNGNANDASGNGYNLINNGATYGTDMFGNTNAAAVFSAGTAIPPAGNFDDSFGGQWMSFGTAAPLDNLSAVTVSMWLNPGNFLPPAAGNAASGRVLYQESVVDIDTQGNSPQGFGFTYGDGNNWFNQTGLDVTNGTAGFSTNGSWVHCVLTADATGQKLFANGALLESDSTLFTGTGTNGYILGLGAYYNGSIDDLRIYNRALSSNEVASLYALEADLPVISQQPQSQTNMFGGSAQFAVTATAQNPLLYQWQFNSANIAGATNAALVLTNLQYTNAGSYGVTISNALAGVTSSNATLTVWQPVPQFATSGHTMTNGAFGISLGGLTGHGPITIYASSNLLSWEAIFTNPPLIGTLQFLDAGSTNRPLRFYRATEQ
ncbi:MAG: immunoglobulin domain-containing protein [Verrucomicrobiae bacterium]|nr:immunoglobulin domain-containing protein [Verrucomicrobiae bacterium]